MQTVGARFEILGKNKVHAMSTMDKHMESPQQSHRSEEHTSELQSPFHIYPVISFDHLHEEYLKNCETTFVSRGQT